MTTLDPIRGLSVPVSEGPQPARGIPRPRRPRPRGRDLRWRREQLMAAGWDELTAHRLASDPSVDVHAILVSFDEERPEPPGARAAKGHG